LSQHRAHSVSRSNTHNNQDFVLIEKEKESETLRLGVMESNEPTKGASARLHLTELPERKRLEVQRQLLMLVCCVGGCYSKQASLLLEAIQTRCLTTGTVSAECDARGRISMQHHCRAGWHLTDQHDVG